MVKILEQARRMNSQPLVSVYAIAERCWALICSFDHSAYTIDKRLQIPGLAEWTSDRRQLL